MFRNTAFGVLGFSGVVLLLCAGAGKGEEKPSSGLPTQAVRSLEEHRQENREIRQAQREGLVESKKKLIARLETALRELRDMPPAEQEAMQERIDAERERLGKLLNPVSSEQTADDDRVRWVNESYPDGKIRSRTPYLARQMHGVREELDSQGVIRARLSYQEGRLHGLCEYFAGDGKPSSEKNYLEGVADGQERVFHPGHYRRLSIERFWREGRLHGEEKEFDRHGTLIRKAVYVAGSRHGVEEFFQPVQGRPARPVRRAFWEWGQFQGQIDLEYDPLEGHRTAELRRDLRLRLSGLCRYYRAGGSVEKEVHYREDQPDGLVEYFEEAGKLVGRERWQAGRRVEEIIPLPREFR